MSVSCKKALMNAPVKTALTALVRKLSSTIADMKMQPSTVRRYICSAKRLYTNQIGGAETINRQSVRGALNLRLNIPSDSI